MASSLWKKNLELEKSSFASWKAGSPETKDCRACMYIAGVEPCTGAPGTDACPMALALLCLVELCHSHSGGWMPTLFPAPLLPLPVFSSLLEDLWILGTHIPA